MEQLNRVELIGIVGNTRQDIFGDKNLIRFTLATTYTYLDKDGTPIFETTWHNISYWGETIEIKKSDKVRIVGRLRNQKYTDANGEEYTTYDILAKSVEKIEDDIVS